MNSCCHTSREGTGWKDQITAHQKCKWEILQGALMEDFIATETKQTLVIHEIFFSGMTSCYHAGMKLFPSVHRSTISRWPLIACWQLRATTPTSISPSTQITSATKSLTKWPHPLPMDSSTLHSGTAGTEAWVWPPTRSVLPPQKISRRARYHTLVLHKDQYHTLVLHKDLLALPRQPLRSHMQATPWVLVMRREKAEDLVVWCYSKADKETLPPMMIGELLEDL